MPRPAANILEPTIVETESTSIGQAAIGEETSTTMITKDDELIAELAQRIGLNRDDLFMKTIANKNKELTLLRADVPALVRAVNQLTLANMELREELAIRPGQQPLPDLHTTNVIPFPSRPVDTTSKP